MHIPKAKVSSIMHGKRVITRLAPPTLTVITATMATLLIGGVANAAVFPSTTAWQLDATTTLITLAVTPASPATDAATTETLTATISPAAADGTVQFTDGSTPLGSPVTVTNGTASTTATLASGAHSLTATFTTTDPAYSGSTSNTVDYTVNGAATGTTGSATATATSTTLVVTPASPATDAARPETLTATISPAAADGVVQFTDGRTFLGNGVTVTNGTASTTVTLPAGKHTLTALFITTDATYSGSISNTVNYPLDDNRNRHGNPGGILGNGSNPGILGGNLGGILGILGGNGGNGGNLGGHRGILGGSAARAAHRP